MVNAPVAWRRITLWAAVTASVLVSGCATLGYYAQSVSGHMRLMSMRVPVNRIIADEQTPERLRVRLRKASEIRVFAHRELDLPDNASYSSYVALDRPYVSWTVVAAPELSLEPKRWCFPVAGCVTYRGYFDERDARRFAAGLSAKGFDVFVSGVQAYSTLGWFDDPLLDTMLWQPEYRLAGIIFHELAHQRVYAKGDASFNEAYAVVVEREGVSRWLEHSGDAELSKRYAAHRKRHDEFLAFIRRGRKALEALYTSKLSDAEKRAGKTAIFERMGAEYRSLRDRWNGYAGYDAWFESGLNNAKMALVATYNEHVQALENMLRSQQGDLSAFHAACEVLARLPAKDRAGALERLRAAPATGSRNPARSPQSTGPAISPFSSSAG